MKSIVKERSYEFALWIISLARWLRERKEYELASQALRSGTSIGANVEEALAGGHRLERSARDTLLVAIAA
jgi:four helix bundle protein